MQPLISSIYQSINHSTVKSFSTVVNSIVLPPGLPNFQTEEIHGHGEVLYARLFAISRPRFAQRICAGLKNSTDEVIL